ncbi:hypothetical protein VDS41_05985 [Xanthomonas campestris pv. campestris]|nr:hypothetical protein [Xanthomonas campestris pv. campestris]
MKQLPSDEQKAMSRNPEIHVFTPELLHQHEMEIASKVHEMTIRDIMYQLARMKPGQVLRASRKGGKDLYWPKEKLVQAISSRDV